MSPVKRLAPCWVCGGLISIRAMQCPHCGEPEQVRTPLRRRKEITLKKWPDWRKINSGKSSGYGTTDLAFAWLACCLQSHCPLSLSISSTFGGYLAAETLVVERTSLHQNTAYRIWTVAEMIKRPAQLKNKMSAKVFMCLPFDSNA